MTPIRFTWLGYQLGLAQPVFLLAVAGAFAIGAIALYRALGRRAQLARAIDVSRGDLLAPGVSTLRPALAALSHSLALVFIGLALAQPQCGERAEIVKRKGIDVVVALDVSKSMYARDIVPSRLERAKLELSGLLDALKGDRIAIVAFAGDAFIQCPLTSDYAAAKLFLRALDPEEMPQGGTNIGSALTLARQVFENADRGAQDRVVVLLSDGEDLTGEIDEGVDALKELGARVLAVGLGSEQGEPIPLINKDGEVTGYKKDATGNTVISRLDRSGLTRIAKATDGEFFYQPKGVAVTDVIAVIDRLQKSELESRVALKYGEAFQPFVALGLVFLMIGAGIVPSWRRAS